MGFTYHTTLEHTTETIIVNLCLIEALKIVFKLYFKELEMLNSESFYV